MIGDFTPNITTTNDKVAENASIVSTTYILFLSLAAVCICLQQLVHRTQVHISSGNNEHFLRFQRTYFAAYFFALFGDWLQGPYIYKLYSHYGFVESQIAALYVAGFGASVFFGTATGVLADKFGRKKMCIVFCLLYSLCCVMKLSPSYHVLLIGRLLGGISTSLLFSTFEAWYIHEHIQTYDFPREWISITFSKATFWNGVLAIFAGVIANISSEWFSLGPVSPFIIAIPFLLFCGLVISRAWKENYGDKSKTSGDTFVEGVRVILSDEKILALGVVQSMFESVMYIFVFLWTPIMDPLHPPLGIVFSVFMICIMIGSSIYRLFCARHVPSEKLLLLANVVAFFSMCGCVFSTDPINPNIYISFICFIFFEIAIGIYFPAIGFLKSQIIPETHRANVMNWFRVPLNIITCATLLMMHSEKNGNRMIFLFCTFMMSVSSITMWLFNKNFSSTFKRIDNFT